MAAPIKVLLIGATGRLGKHADALLQRTSEFEVVCRLSRGEVREDLISASGASVALEMTAAGHGFEHAGALLRGGVRPVVATSGVSPNQGGELNGIALELQLGGLVVPNFSLGMFLLQRAAVEMARMYPRAEIVETHHVGKLDAPSGTSLATRHMLEQARTPYAEAPSIPIHSLRLPGVLANQEVSFGGEGEILRVSHETYGPEAYDAGILASLRYAAGCRGVGYGVGLAFENSL